ncbi:MAG: aspartate aminotransferase family protein [Candidatus Geothermarchaeales archaeon]
MSGYEQLEARTAESRAFHEKASLLMPGGVSANLKFFEPYPLAMKKARGSRLFDVDGNEYVDYLMAYGALILGHNHPSVADAVAHVLKDVGTNILGAPSELELDMAETLLRLYSFGDMVRFTNSGLEATLLACRLARLHTGRGKIAKFEGHYHGAHEAVLVSVFPKLRYAGSSKRPSPVPDSRDLVGDSLENTVVLPFNDTESCTEILEEEAEDLSCVILEPVQRGYILAERGFLSKLRKITQELGVLLIYDEVKTGFRIALGGAREFYGVSPDLSCLGKVIGGGFPIGAVVGGTEIMESISPNRPDTGKPPLFHSGTFNGNTVSMAAGLATLETLSQRGSYPKIFGTTEMLREQMEEAFSRYGLEARTVGAGAIFNLVPGHGTISNYRDALSTDWSMRRKLDYELLSRGVYIKPLGRFSPSLAHSEEDVLQTVEALDQSLRQIPA